MDRSTEQRPESYREGLPQSRDSHLSWARITASAPAVAGHELCAINRLAGTPRPVPSPGDLLARDFAAFPPDCLLQDQTDGGWWRTVSDFWSPKQVQSFPIQADETKMTDDCGDHSVDKEPWISQGHKTVVNRSMENENSGCISYY